MKVYIIDAFTDKPFNGNQAGVVILEKLTEQDMQIIAREINLSETVFIEEINPDYYKLRYFTPIQEIPYCGHATIAAGFLLSTLKSYNEMVFNTHIGDIPINIINGTVFIEAMKTEQKSYTGDKVKLLDSLGLEESDIAGEIFIGNNGFWDVFIPLKSYNKLIEIIPDLDMLKEHNSNENLISTHLFCLCKNSPYYIYARNFGPACGIPEDYVTGSSNGTLVNYLVEHLSLSNTQFKIQQGNPKVRLGEILVNIQNNKISIGGKAVIMIEGKVSK